MLSVRRRKLPADVVVWLVLGANLIAGMAFDEVVRHLALTPPTRRASPQTPPSSSAVSDARGRLGDVAMRELFSVTSRHWRDLDDFTHLRFHGLQVLAADGFALRTPDTSSNAAEFGKPSSRRGDAAYPVVNAVAVIEVATRDSSRVGAVYDGRCTLPASGPSTQADVNWIVAGSCQTQPAFAGRQNNTLHG
jgi:hypothetical protein